MEIKYPNIFEKKILDNYSQNQNSSIKNIKKFTYLHPKLNEKKFDLLRMYKMLKHYGVRKYFTRYEGKVNFLIAGFQKTGSTSLHNYLIQHPNLEGPWTKDLHFFSYAYDKGIDYYHSNFRFNSKKEILHFESSDGDILHPSAMRRINEYNPEMKIIICLRNPIDQVYSHYNQKITMGEEIQSLEDAIKDDDDRKKLHLARLENNIYNYVAQPIILPYLYMAEYSTHLKNAFNEIPKERFFIIDSNELKNNTQEIINDVFEFLGLEKKRVDGIGEFLHSYEYKKKMSKETRHILKEYFTPFNEELEKMLNRKFNWK